MTEIKMKLDLSLIQVCIDKVSIVGLDHLQVVLKQIKVAV